MFGIRESDREFMRQLVLRMERSERLVVAELGETRRELSAGMTDIKDELVEMRADQRASREALFRILNRLDRLDRGGGSAPA